MPAGWMEGSAAQECSVQLLSTPRHGQPLLHLLVRHAETHCNSGRLSPADATSCPCGLCPCHAGGVEGPSQHPQAVSVKEALKAKDNAFDQHALAFVQL